MKFAIALSAATFFFAINGAEAVPLSRSSEMPTIQSEAVKVGCAGGKQCATWGMNGGVRVCKKWVACR